MADEQTKERASVARFIGLGKDVDHYLYWIGLILGLGGMVCAWH
jgi:hypothetical protein